MHIKEVIIDGFKSYAQRTVIDGWDREFNAITGLNGSGKSNILDAICFVLGISNLSQVRASQLQDLVYKQGQAGITKASVSLVFDNSDPRQSPVGYEHCETITVNRQVVIGGRNKYMINGTTVQASAVQNLFHSVQLNVNNPHFLIMQGRITKVLNMKPPEILGLLEEAAGTRMFQSKKEAALKTIEKKQAKVEEIDKVLKEEITPTLDKLRTERTNYLRWAQLNGELDRLRRFVIAWQFSQAETMKTEGAGAVAAAQEELAAATAAVVELKKAALAKQAEIDALEKKKLASMDAEYQKLSEGEAALGKEAVRASTSWKHKAEAAAAEDKALAKLRTTAAESDGVVAGLQKQMEKQKADSSAASAEAAALSQAVTQLQARYTAVSAGMGLDDAAGDGAGSTIADQLIAAKARVTALNAEISQREMKVKHLRSRVKDLTAAVKEAEKEGKGLQATLEKAGKAVETKRAALAAMGFDASEQDGLRVKKDSLSAAVTSLGEAYEGEWAGLSALVEFTYERAGLGASWNDDRVKGTVAQLVRVKRPEAATALEVAAGGKLYQVVVDNEVTGKALVEKGRLKKRVTIIPLNQIRDSVIPEAKVAAAASLSKGAAVPALSLVGYPEEVTAAMRYAFGSTFICDTSAVAKAIAYDPSVRVQAVTLEGDTFDPAGTLEGGSAPGMAGGQPLLLRLARVHDMSARLEAAKKELAAVEARLSALAAAGKEHAKLSGEVEMASHELALTQQRMASSSLGQTQAKLADATREAEEEETAIAAAKAALKETQARVKDLEAIARNATQAREAKMAEIEKELQAKKKAAAAAETAAKKLMHGAHATQCEMEQTLKEKEGLASAIAGAEASAAAAHKEADALKAQLDEVTQRYTAAKEALTAAKTARAAADKQLKALYKERNDAVSGSEEAEAAGKRLQAKIKELQAGAASADRTIQELLAAHNWIDADRSMFGQAHTDYDFARNNPAEAQKRLAKAEKEQAELGRTINKKVMGMFEQAEREHNDLRTKKLIIEKDKEKIENVIRELEEKKNAALKTTWVKVNKDFGSIFSTLLPGTTAKLEPPEGGTVLDGLEVRVAFNAVWKESLTELSGGQRSLLALSLILALLLFKPAPMYILDEVDAALDLSHTQNIGHMIRTHFGHSQFIVVSLKQGMFSNANVIFRTKFVDNTSTVTRTVPAGSAQLMGSGSGGAHGGAGRAALADMDTNAVSARGGGKGSKAGKAKAARVEAEEAEAEEDGSEAEVMPVARRRGGAGAAAATV